MDNILGKRWIRWLLPGVIALAVGAAGIYGYRYLAEGKKQDNAVRQATAVVQKGDLTVKVSGTGSIEPVERKSVNAGFSGTIQEVRVREGDEVKQGDVLMVFETEDVSSQIRAKELELQKSLLDLEQLQENYKTADDAARPNIRLSIEKQRLSIASLEEDLAELMEKRQAKVLTAPIDGKIVALNVQAGDTVNTNALVAEIANFNRLQIVVPIDELDIPEVQLGQKAEIRVEAYPDEIFSGVVSKIADQGTSSNGVAAFDVTVLIDEPGKIKSGMTAEASILVNHKSDVLLLPIDAVQSFGGRYFVLVPGAGEEDGARGQTTEGAPRRESSGIGREGRTAGDGESGESGRGAARGRPAAGSDALPQGRSAANRDVPSANRRVFIETGIHNEDYIEVVSGLSEGDVVLMPTVRVEAAAGQFRRESGGAFPGGFPGGPMGFPGGGRR